MQIFEVVPGLFIATRLDTSTEYASLEVDAIVDLEDWKIAWTPPVPLGRIYVSFPMGDGDEVDPNVRQLASFIASLVTSGRRVLVHCTEGLNRSGLVVARALMDMGLTASDAIDLVRRERGPSVDGFPALSNEASSIGCIGKPDADMTYWTVVEDCQATATRLPGQSRRPHRQAP